MPSDAAKNAKTCFTKCCSSSVSLAQSLRSCARSSSSAVQKLASAFLYISQMRGYWIGKMTKRFGFSLSMGSLASSGWRLADMSKGEKGVASACQQSASDCAQT